MTPCPSSGRSTFGEALIVAVSLIGYLALAWNNMAPTLLGYASILGMIAGFYAVLLIVRTLFTFIAGDGQFWWQDYTHDQRPVTTTTTKKK